MSKVVTNADFNRLVWECKKLPKHQKEYICNNFIENLLLTVLDFQMRGEVVGRSIEHFRESSHKNKIKNLKNIKEMLGNADEENQDRKIAQELFGYNHWTRIQLLRRLVRYFESTGVPDVWRVENQKQLVKWANKVEYESHFKGKVKGAGIAIFKWLVMRQGVNTIKPDTMLHKFFKETVGYNVDDNSLIKIFEKVAGELKIRANELDWSIWEYQRSKG